MKHKPLCLIVSLLVFIGALNLGLTGLGGFLNMDLNVLNMLFGAWPLVVNIVYLLIGLAALTFVYGIFKCHKLCSTCEVKKEEETPKEEAPAEPSEPEAPSDTSSEAPTEEEEPPMGQ